MSAKILYRIGTAAIFLGLSWMFLPHIYHEQIFNFIGKDSSAEFIEESHITHTFQGLIALIPGLFLIFYATREQNHPILKLFKAKNKINYN